jgi:hypothetical protein
MSPPDRSHPAPSPLHGRGPLVALLLLALVLLLAAVAFRWALWGKPPAVVVTGTVTSGGRPVVFGTVTFLGADHRAHTVTIGPDGRFRAKHLPTGVVRIAVSSPEPRPDLQHHAAAQVAAKTDSPLGPRHGPAPGLAGAGQDMGKAATPMPGRTIAAPAPSSPTATQPSTQPSARRAGGWFRIPGRYANPLTSGLGGHLEIGDNQLDLRVD